MTIKRSKLKKVCKRILAKVVDYLKRVYYGDLRRYRW
jgi:hypothetical protein